MTRERASAAAAASVEAWRAELRMVGFCAIGRN